MYEIVHHAIIVGPLLNVGMSVVVSLELFTDD